MKKLTLFAMALLASVVSFAALNPFAYGLSSSLSDDAATLTVNYSLNAEATSVSIVLLEGEDVVKTVDCTDLGLAKGNYTVEIPTEGLPEGKRISWKVEVTGAAIDTPTEHPTNYGLYHPSAVDIDNNPENPTFGLILVNEAMHSIKGNNSMDEYKDYLSYNIGAGIYALNPAFEPIENNSGTYGYNGGIEFTTTRADNESATAYSPRRIRISDDGRIFVTSLNTDGTYLWEVNPENLDEWTPVFQGASVNEQAELLDADSNFIAAPNVGFDVKGAGENLQLMMYSANLLGIVANMGGFRCDEYNLGTATTWATAPSKNWVLGKYAINYVGTQVVYDNEGGLWIASYRMRASDAEPGLVHINADGVEDSKLIWNYVRQAGIRFNNDFTKLVVAGNNGTAKKATVYTISKDPNGAPVLTEETVIDMAVVGNNLNDFAWDYAGNLYSCGNSGEKIVAWAMPRTADEVVSTPAASKYTFHLGELLPEYTITATSADEAMGTVTGSGTYFQGDTVILKALAKENCEFVNWSNGSTEATLTFIAEKDSSVIANFKKDFNTLTAITYELNGGVTNAHGWLSKAHMCLDLQNDYNTAYSSTVAWSKEENGVVYYYINGEWKLPEEVVGIGADVTGFIQNVTYNTSDNLVKLLQTEKWLPLGDYINNLRVAAGNAVADEGAMRAELSGFFLNSPALADWRKTNDYTIAGQPAAFCPVMKMGFDNPTEVAFEVTLNDPYRAEFTFAGWYAAADFSGEKVTKVSPESLIAGGKLYAKWVEYIPSIAEVMAMAEGTETKISGVVNWVRNNNVFIQDNTGGFLLYGTDLAPEVGTKIVAKGKRSSFYGSPQLSNTVIESSEKSELYAPVLTDLATLCADTTALKYFGKRVQVLGVKVAEYDNYGNIYVTDGTNKVKGHYMVPDQTVFAVGKKVDIVAVASQYKGTVQFEGDVEGLTLSVVALQDTYAYPTRGEHNQYKLENRWVISNVMGNFAANAPGGDQKVRGMAAKDDKMYFINRELESLIVVDGKTGDMLDNIKIIGEHLFEVENEDGTWSSAVTFKCCDIKFDNAGNCLISALVMNSQTFFIYEVDLETGAATEVIKERLWDNPDIEGLSFRLDAFGVNGDIHDDACIMAADEQSCNVYRWLITNGVADNCEQIGVDTWELLISSFGAGAKIYPIDEMGDLFYVDGNNTYPILVDGNGMLVGNMAYCSAGMQIENKEGDVATLHTALNGIQEFNIGNEYFLIMAATHTLSTPPAAFALYKYDEDLSFENLEPLWYFPADGFGSAANGLRTAVPSVEVNGNKATIYLYSQNNGYACYELEVKASTPTLVENTEVNSSNVQKIFRDGHVLIIRDGKTYSVIGQEME